jgi:hypothetical protein
MSPFEGSLWEKTKRVTDVSEAADLEAEEAESVTSRTFSMFGCAAR